MQKLSDVNKLVSDVSSKEEALHVPVNNAGAVRGDRFVCSVFEPPLTVIEI